MYAKIFAQIFDSSIADNWQHRHVFEDLLKLADRNGVVDMTVEAVIARTRLPRKMVEEGIKVLSLPDPNSRTKDEEGRRIVLIDPNRSWGWRIVNHGMYREIKTEFDRTAYMADYMRRRRAQLNSVKLESNAVKLSASESVQCCTRSTGRGGESEGNQKLHNAVRVSRRPRSLAEAVAAGEMIGMSEADCVAWFNDCEACDWTRGDGTPFDHWRRQQVLHRDRLRENQSRNGGTKQPSVSDIRTAIAFKEERAKALRDKYSTEGPVCTDWSDPQKKKEFFDLKKEIKALKAKVERMVS